MLWLYIDKSRRPFTVIYPKDSLSWQFSLTNRFHAAVSLFSNRSQMTSKCGKNKKVAREAIAERVTDAITTFWRLL